MKTIAIESILLPVVGSQHSRRAVEIGAWWAKAYDSKITLLHVIPPVGDEDVFLAQSHHRHRHDFATHLLDGFAEELRHDGLLVDTLVVEHVWPEKAIVECLNGRHSVVILGTNLKPLSGRAFLGHCVEYVLEHADPAVITLSMP
jgi:nucleotide-binding universal stress UspA family protein